MADPAIDPYNPDDTGAPQAEHAPAADAPRAETDPPIEEPADLEAQVEGLLKDVTDAVEDIHQKLNPEPHPEYTDLEAIDSELAAFAEDAPDGSFYNDPKDTPEEAIAEESAPESGLPEPEITEPASIEPDATDPDLAGPDASEQDSVDEEAAQPETVEPELTEAEAPDDQIPDDLIAEEPTPEEDATDGVDPVAEASHPDEPTSAEPEHEPAPERAPETAPQLDPEPDPEPVQETDPLSAVQAALEDAVSTESELEPDLEAVPEPRPDSEPADTPTDTPDDSLAEHPSATGRAPTDQPLTKDEVDTAEPIGTPEADPADAGAGAPPVFTDGDSLEDELAALSADAPKAPDETEPVLAEHPSATGRAPADGPLTKDDADTTEAGHAPEADSAEAPPEYTDGDSLEDELAALSADAPDESAPAEAAVQPDSRDGADPDTPPDYIDSAAIDDELAALAAAALDEDAPEGDIEADAPPEPSETAVSEPAPSEPEPEPVPAQAPIPAAEAAPASRWGWLPPKPDWPEVYSRWRPLVIAWRHIAWIVPPLAVFLWTTAWAWFAPRAKNTAIKAEPHVRLVVAKISAPLSRRDERTRSIIGWFAVYTLFVSAALWVYILVGRSAVTPEPTAPATGLARETATAEANN